MTPTNIKGFSYLEIVISLVLLSLISSGLTLAFYAPLSGLKTIEDKKRVFIYSQKMIEKVVNTPFERIQSTERINYTHDPEFQYEIKINHIKPNLKSVYLNFFKGIESYPLSQLFYYTTTQKIKIIEDFEVNGFNDPPFDWEPNPQGSWNIDSFDNTYPGGIRRLRYSHLSTQIGTAFPKASSIYPLSFLNFSLESDVYIFRQSGDETNSFSFASIGGRCNSQGNGYFLIFEIEPMYSRSRVRLAIRNGNNETTLSITPFSGQLFFNRWISLKFELNDNKLYYYVNGSKYGPFTDNTFKEGGIILRAQNRSGSGMQRYVYYDNIKIEY